MKIKNYTIQLLLICFLTATSCNKNTSDSNAGSIVPDNVILPGNYNSDTVWVYESSFSAYTVSKRFWMVRSDGKAIILKTGVGVQPDTSVFVSSRNYTLADIDDDKKTDTCSVTIACIFIGWIAGK